MDFSFVAGKSPEPMCGYSARPSTVPLVNQQQALTMSFLPEISKIQYEGPKKQEPAGVQHYNPMKSSRISG